MTAEEERRLRALVGPRLTTAPGATANEFRVKATSYVGAVVLGDMRILVQPKVPTNNLFHMLEVDGRTLGLADETFDYGVSDDLAAAFATFYARVLERAMGAGVPHEYVTQKDDLAGIRGRVDLVAQRRRCGVVIPTACEFDEYTADTQLNRILRAAAERMLRVPGVTVATRRRLVHLTGRLIEAGPLRPGDLRHQVQFTRLNSKLRPAHNLARLILDRSGIVTLTGTANASAFLIDMNKVFETFIEVRLRQYLSGILNVHGQRTLTLDVGGSVAIRPDLVFSRPTDARDTYVADTKYKLTANGYGREADYYQLLAYSTALGLDEGLLIYCQHDGETPPRAIEARHAGTNLRTAAVRLGGSIADLEESMRALADEIAHSAAHVQTVSPTTVTNPVRPPGTSEARPMTVRHEILRAFERLERRHGRFDFRLADIAIEVQSATTQYAESSIRTHVVSLMCANAPVNHGTTYRDLERVDRGIYRRLMAADPGEDRCSTSA